MRPKVLFFDIETSPIVAYIWSLGKQVVSVPQIVKDWSVLSWAAKWQGSSEVMYQDQRGLKDLKNDKALVSAMKNLLEESDIVVTQNGRKFDSKKLNTRFLIHGLKPPRSYKHIDTLVINRKHFGFTSNKLEYLCEALDLKYKKLKDRKYQGLDLWKECLSDNLDAWKEMEKYNKRDVLALEELYNKVIPWDSSFNFSLYSDLSGHICTCGSKTLKRNGFSYTATGKYQRYACTDCGAEVRDRKNLFDDEKKSNIKVGIKK